MATEETYAQTAQNKVRRYGPRGVYDHDRVHNIVNAASLVHVAFNPPPLDGEDQFPVILPMLGAIGTFVSASPSSEAEPHVYLHGSSAARLMRMGADAPTGLAICIEATLLDGYVLALTPFSHSCNYRSAVVFGNARLLTDAEERLWAMELITNNTIPDRWANSRVPPTKSELTATAILKVRIVSASAKQRAGGPHDDRKDLKDGEMRKKVWTGVVPVHEALGEPIASPDNLVEKVPSYVTGWVEQANEMTKSHAVERANDP
ncbi:hypothetical protein LTR66_002536 [Elasticomyces elasticus]|nr:hypothetical protein LTR66_002536 [Elasticomyces elasticus]